MITGDGEIKTWGWGEHGQLGIGDTRDQINLVKKKLKMMKPWCEFAVVAGLHLP